MEQTDELQINSLAGNKYSGKYAMRMRSGVKTERPQAEATAWAFGGNQLENIQSFSSNYTRVSVWKHTMTIKEYMGG